MAILEMQHISKAFGGVKALSDVHLTVEAGEIHALLGENGAGKSTLMNILTGVIATDTGEIHFDGKNYPNPTIAAMERAGIAFVHQEVNVVNDLSVFENIFLHREIKTKLGLLDRKRMVSEASELFTRLGVDIDPCAMVSELKTSQKQLLEISRALYANAKLLILDEPTTALSTQEVEHLFGILRKLKAQGHSFIFISHKMPEIFEIADRYTVLRNGLFISDGNINETTPHQIASDMVGEQYLDKDYYEPRTLGETLVELKHFTGKGFTDVSLSVRKGEIIAFTGLAGSGASELMQTMFGVLPMEGGSIRIGNKVIRGAINRFMRCGFAMLPSNRKENSVVPDMNILENTCLAEHTLSRGRQLILPKKEMERYEALKKLLWIKAGSSSDSILSLSGGNQQKVFLARWLNTKADVLLLDNPTQGVDVGAKAEIYRLILEFANQGMTVIINTLEIPEIKKVSDRCVVFFEGRVAKIFEHDEINEHDVMLYSTNAINARIGVNHAG
jgi:ribose transport system ATP-binding protein